MLAELKSIRVSSSQEARLPRFYLITALMLPLLFGGCATIMGKSEFPVTFTSIPAEARVEVRNERGELAFEGQTPTTAVLPAARGFFEKHQYIATFRKEGHERVERRIPASVSSWYWGNLALGGFPGMLIVDPATGAMYQIDTSEVSVEFPRVLPPEPPEHHEVKRASLPSVPAARPKLDPKRVVSTGTGWFAINGSVVTNHHVIVGASAIFLRLKNGTILSAKTVKVDKDNDLAILMPEGETSLPPGLPLSGRPAAMGAPVFTIGYPLASLLGVEQKLSNGIVSSISGINGDGRFLQMSTPVQPGNSGGPLMNDRGEVIGVVTSKLSLSYTLKATGSIPEGIGYAIKVDRVRDMLSALSPPAQDPAAASAQPLEVLAGQVSQSIVMVVAQ